MSEFVGVLFYSLVDLIQAIPSDLRDPGIGEGRAIVITFTMTLLTATIAYIFGRRRDLRNFRNTNSMAHYQTERPDLNLAIRELQHHIYNHRECSTSMDHETVAKEREIIGKLVNHFEVLSIGISSGFLSETYVRRTERTNIIYLFMAMSSHITLIREYYANPYAIIQYEKLFIRTHIGIYRNILIPIEAIVGRPLFDASYYMFRMEYFIYSRSLKAICKSERLCNLLPDNHMHCDWVYVRKIFSDLRNSLIISLAILIVIWNL